jgi:hypothetical protein
MHTATTLLLLRSLHSRVNTSLVSSTSSQRRKSSSSLSKRRATPLARRISILSEYTISPSHTLHPRALRAEYVSSSSFPAAHLSSNTTEHQVFVHSHTLIKAHSPTSVQIKLLQMYLSSTAISPQEVLLPSSSGDLLIFPHCSA